MQAQELINHDQPYGFEVHPKNVVAYNKTVWDPAQHGRRRPASASATSGPGSTPPLAAQKDIILNSRWRRPPT